MAVIGVSQSVMGVFCLAAENVATGQRARPEIVLPIGTDTGTGTLAPTVGVPGLRPSTPRNL